MNEEEEEEEDKEEDENENEIYLNPIVSKATNIFDVNAKKFDENTFQEGQNYRGWVAVPIKAKKGTSRGGRRRDDE